MFKHASERIIQPIAPLASTTVTASPALRVPMNARRLCAGRAGRAGLSVLIIFRLPGRAMHAN